MKKIYALALFIFTTISFGQTTDEPGYFINNDGSRTDCLIRHIDWRNNPTEFEYRLTEDASYSKGTIATVAEFSVKEYKYVRTEVDIDQSSEQLRLVTTTKEPVFKRMTVFLRVLVDGSNKLYHYVGEDTNKYFFSTPEKPIEQLIFKSYMPEASAVIANSYLRENTYFRQQLWNNVKCDDAKIGSVESLAYKMGDLVKYFEKVNVCTDGEKTQEKRTVNKGSLALKAVIIANSSTLSIKSTLPYGSFDFGNQITIGYGIEVEYVLPFNNKKWSIFFEPTLNNYKGEGILINPFGTIQEEKIEVDIKYWNLPIGVRYHFILKNNSAIFVNTAFNVMAISEKSSVTYERHPDRNFGNTSMSLAFGVGYKYDRFSVETRIQSKQQLAPGATEEWNFNTVTLAGRFRFL